MTAPSQTPEAAGLEVVAWRRVDPNGKTSTTDRPNTLYVWRASRRNVEPLVTAASAQAAIDAEKARADRLAKVMTELMPAVRAYVMTGDVMSQSIKKNTWNPVLAHAAAALQQEG